MSYKSISIKDAIEKINDKWYIPNIQRPYVWGERYQKEEFIYKLFDSILRRYPIGTLLVWPTKKEIPFRDFLKDYDSKKISKLRDKGVWGQDKELVYDGQQRLQSFYSCLKFTFHKKVLCYDLFFNPSSSRETTGKTECGFIFLGKDEELEPNYLRMTELFKCKRGKAYDFEECVLKKLPDVSPKNRGIVKKNLKELWWVFVERERELISYYELDGDYEEKEALDIFIRLNTTGVTPSKSDILFSRVKGKVFYFEEKIWNVSEKINKITHGYSFSPDDILQTIFLIKKNTMRVDPDKVRESELEDFGEIWGELEKPLTSFFHDFLFQEFKINHSAIIPSRRALLPMISYFYYAKKNHNLEYKEYSEKSIRNLKKYFILSQGNEWTYQAYIDNFRKIIVKSTYKKLDRNNLSFPFYKIREFVKDDGRRHDELKLEFLEQYDRWFYLKILSPNRAFSFVSDNSGRFNPEIDHIFPKTPKDANKYPKRYFKWVETLWNLQPIKGNINNLKLNTLPKKHFKNYPAHLTYYDHLPTKDLNNPLWLKKNAHKFIIERKKKMIEFMKSRYGLVVKEK